MQPVLDRPWWSWQSVLSIEDVPSPLLGMFCQPLKKDRGKSPGSIYSPIFKGSSQKIGWSLLWQIVVYMQIGSGRQLENANGIRFYASIEGFSFAQMMR